MKVKTVTARKSHTCDVCSKQIQAGERYELTRTKFGVYDCDPETRTTGGQVGIAYQQTKVCMPCASPNCGNHKFVPEKKYDGWAGGSVWVPTGNEICENCGTLKTQAQ